MLKLPRRLVVIAVDEMDGIASQSVTIGRHAVVLAEAEISKEINRVVWLHTGVQSIHNHLIHLPRICEWAIAISNDIEVSKVKVGRKPSVSHDDDYAGMTPALFVQHCVSILNDDLLLRTVLLIRTDNASRLVFCPDVHPAIQAEGPSARVRLGCTPSPKRLKGRSPSDKEDSCAKALSNLNCGSYLPKRLQQHPETELRKLHESHQRVSCETRRSLHAIGCQFPIDIIASAQQAQYVFGPQLAALQQAGLVSETETTAIVHGMLDALRGATSPPTSTALSTHGRRYKILPASSRHV